MRTVLIAILLLCPLALSAAEDQGVAITIYNDNLALVKDTRLLTLPTGKGTVAFTDVSAQIDPTSVHFASLSGRDQVAILEQNYQYDLVDQGKLLSKYLDKQIQLIRYDQNGKEIERRTVTLLAQNNGFPSVIRTDTGIELTPTGKVELPTLAEGLITRPTLVWGIDNAGPAKQSCQISYLTGGLNWHSEYVAVVDQDDKKLSLNGWVSIENNSGATYKDAKLKLIAGDVNRVQPVPPPYPRAGKMDMMMSAEAAPQFEEKSFFEYHLYTLQRPATVANSEIKQISLFPETEVAAKKLFIFDGARNAKKVQVKMEFLNAKSAGLGMALPKGKIRVYKADDDGSLEFVGEDQIDHTPRDERVRILLGNAFDIVGERAQMNYRKLSTDRHEEDFRIVLRNHKKEKVEVTVVEHMGYGEWEVRSETSPHAKLDSHTSEWTLPVAANDSTELRYTVRYEY